MTTINIANNELFLRGLSAYFDMTIKEFAEVIGNDPNKLYRFYKDFKENHN